MKGPTIELDLEVKVISSNAIGVLNLKDIVVWVPLQYVETDDEIVVGDISVEIPEWLAIQKELT